MKCPSCAAELKYVERTKRTCPKCRQPFALEPRDTSLAISDLRLRGLAERASAEGSRNYPLPQLWYYASRRRLQELAGTPGGRVAGVVFALLVSLVCGFFGSIASTALTNSFLIRAGVGLAIVAAAVFLVIRSLRTIARPMPISLGEFQAKVVEPWLRRYQAPPQGLVPEETLARLRGRQPPAEATVAVLASPDGAVLDCLRANGLPEQLGLALLHVGDKQPPHPGVVALLRERPALPLLLLHDASAQGCLLPHTLPAALGLPADRHVIDLGLRPRDVQRDKLLVIRGDAPAELLGMLNQRAASGGGLERDEIAWLRRGALSPVAALPVGRLLNLVRRAVLRASGADPEARARAQAQAVGFMSWPG